VDHQTWFRHEGFNGNHPVPAPKNVACTGVAGPAAWLPYTQRAPETQRDEFITATVERCVAGHPPDEAGRIRVRMVRLEIDAVKG
jgi:hypothetical protein